VSAVRIHVPPVRLAKLLRTPGGLPVADAIRRAGAGLESLRGECLTELKGVLDSAESCAARGGAQYDRALLDELYTIVATPIGIPSVCGLASVDTALISLSDLLDYLKGQERWDANAVAVHLAQAGTQAILAGLRKVSQRYARPETPTA